MVMNSEMKITDKEWSRPSEDITALNILIRTCSYPVEVRNVCH